MDAVWGRLVRGPDLSALLARPQYTRTDPGADLVIKGLTPLPGGAQWGMPEGQPMGNLHPWGHPRGSQWGYSPAGCPRRSRQGHPRGTLGASPGGPAQGGQPRGPRWGTSPAGCPWESCQGHPWGHCGGQPRGAAQGPRGPDFNVEILVICSTI